MNKIINRAKEQGYKIVTYNSEQLKEYDKERKKTKRKNRRRT